MTLMGLMVFQCLVFFLQSDVNTMTFADESGHIIYFGSDDHLCKVISPLDYLFCLLFSSSTILSKHDMAFLKSFRLVF